MRIFFSKHCINHGCYVFISLFSVCTLCSASTASLASPAHALAQLMVKIAPLVGSAKTQELLYTRFVKMCTCKIHFVRKECATAFPVMCEVLGNEMFEKNLVSFACLKIGFQIENGEH